VLKNTLKKLKALEIQGLSWSAYFFTDPFGGGEESRTPVRNHIHKRFYGCILYKVRMKTSLFRISLMIFEKKRYITAIPFTYSLQESYMRR